jgi:hypothetical protein
MVLGQHGGPVVEAGTRFAAPIREPWLHLVEGMSVMGVREICDDCGSQRPRPSGAWTGHPSPASKYNPTMEAAWNPRSRKARDLGHPAMWFVCMLSRTLWWKDSIADEATPAGDSTNRAKHWRGIRYRRGTLRTHGFLTIIY